MWANKGTLRSCSKAKVEAPMLAIEQCNAAVAQCQTGTDVKALPAPSNYDVTPSKGEAMDNSVTATVAAAAIEGAPKAQSE